LKTVIFDMVNEPHVTPTSPCIDGAKEGSGTDPVDVILPALQDVVEL
jgi:hypothetical protein